jgi:UDP-N-acetylglucosamine 1-carboxyvinyltransferase
MEKFVIKGLTKGVKGLIDISGSKNAVLPLMFSSILFNDIITLKNVPFVSDVITTKNLLESLGSKVEISEKNKTIKIINKKKHKLIVPYKLISTMRAGVLAMGALLGRYQACSVSRPGGCSLGSRPIGWHLKGFNKLGAKYSLNKGYINVSAKNGLKGNVFKFPKVSVTGTSNLIMASIYVKGTTTLENISIEPEVIELISFLNRCEAQIRFKEKRTIQINGVKKLKGCTYEVIGDRIEAFSYLCTAAITRGKIKISKINPKHLKSELQVLKKIGCDLNIKESTIVLSAKKKLRSIKMRTAPYPGFATDNMPMLMAVLTKAKGISQIEETIFSNRYMAAPELVRMGASISIKGSKAIIIGKEKLHGAECISSDLRTTFSIILGAIGAVGTSQVARVFHGFRGYYNLEKKLKKIGVKIRRIA